MFMSVMLRSTSCSAGRGGGEALDDLIKKGIGGVSEKGPLFKMEEGQEDILFPQQVEHSLLI